MAEIAVVSGMRGMTAGNRANASFISESWAKITVFTSIARYRDNGKYLQLSQTNNTDTNRSFCVGL